MTEDKTPTEPSDRHIYGSVLFGRESLVFFSAAVRMYMELLEKDLSVLQADPDLAVVLDLETLQSYPIAKEFEQAKRVHQWLERHIAQAEKRSIVHISIGHDLVRFLKSVGILYLAHLRQKRDAIAARPTTSKALLQALDQQLAHTEEQAGQGIFKGATPYPLVIEQLPPAAAAEAPTPTTQAPAHPPRPRPVVLDSIEIRDADLRRRCLDLLEQFRQDGEHDRLDTVVSEATRILEARLRLLAAAEPGCSGVDLATFAFKGTDPRLRVSQVAAEQEAAHLLYRGVFGFVRNSAHHRLLGDLQPERVLQIVGMVDYLMSVAEAAERNVPGTPQGEA